VSKQGSDGKCGKIETYVDKWDIESVKGENELSKLELLFEGMKLDGNLLLCNFLEVDDVRAFDSVLGKDGQLMVNIAPTALDDKSRFMNTKNYISQSGLP
jgi:hypothetical protein